MGEPQETQESAEATPEERRALFRVVRGTPDARELAALTAVVAAAASVGGPPPRRGRRTCGRTPRPSSAPRCTRAPARGAPPASPADPPTHHRPTPGPGTPRCPGRARSTPGVEGARPPGIDPGADATTGPAERSFSPWTPPPSSHGRDRRPGPLQAVPRQFVGGSRDMKLPLIVIGIGVLTLAQARPEVTAAGLALLAAELVLTAGLGVLRGYAFRLGTRDGWAYRSGSAAFWSAWVLTIGVRVGAGVPRRGRRGAGLLLSTSSALVFGGSLLVQSLVLRHRVDAAGLPVRPAEPRRARTVALTGPPGPAAVSE
ncbi:acyl-CoA carboxylase epsilon subunit [Pseudonocardia sp. ICBG601]|uniref:acyl-CoA carboxylase epsilon subunit n=1 Tax=Pseudonocardia sp. ICBG601 TaxID=2846759 RepID=UPI0027E3AC47|nr:acyl-CoA carboxylase epsilon subunit [Pseudonocardia sp. ICBG601]